MGEEESDDGIVYCDDEEVEEPDHDETFGDLVNSVLGGNNDHDHMETERMNSLRENEAKILEMEEIKKTNKKLQMEEAFNAQLMKARVRSMTLLNEEKERRSLQELRDAE